MDDQKGIRAIAVMMLLLAVLQLLRMGIEQVVFAFVQRTNYTDDMATMLAMLLLTIGFSFHAAVRRVPLSIFPQRFGLGYILASLLLIGLLVSSLILTGEPTWQAITVMIYSNVVTPIFEEIIFRGYLWNKLNAIVKRETTTYLLVTLLFALWHLGYIEGIAFRAPGNLARIMFWKVVVGFCFGVILGVVRLRTKNCYSTILLHGMMNIFGR